MASAPHPRFVQFEEYQYVLQVLAEYQEILLVADSTIRSLLILHEALVSTS